MPSGERAEPDVRRVLVVEDDSLVSETIAAMLDGHYEAVVAATVERALELLDSSAHSPANDRLQLILLDCLLPGGGLARILQAADEHAIPVVLISGDPERAAQLDLARPFLPKPFNQAKLLRVLQAAC